MFHRIFGAALVVVAFALTTAFPGSTLPQVLAEDLTPTAADRLATSRVIEIIQDKHLLKKQLDRQMAGEALDGFVTTLDSSKLFFYKGDIDEFNRRKFDLADQLKEGNISIAFDIYRRYQQRVSEAEKVWKDLLSTDNHFDFTVNEVVVVNPQSREYATNEKVFREQWRLEFKYNLLNQKVVSNNNNFNLKESRALLLDSYIRFARGVRETKRYKVLEWFLNQVGYRYDVGTSYTSPGTIAEYEDRQRGHFVGIGVVLKNNSIVSIIPGGPADNGGGLKANDLIVSVGQGNVGPMADVTLFSLEELIELVRGTEGSIVRIGIKRPGHNQILIQNVTRGKVVAEESKIESRIERIGAIRVGFIDVPDFYRDANAGTSTVADVTRLLEQFNGRGVEVLVLDLRRCRGGYLDQAIGLSGLFIGKGPILQSKTQAGNVQTSANQVTEMGWNKPLVVLTGKNSAGGAEIVCAVVQDYQRGIVVGDDSTYGMGLIRSNFDVGDAMGFVSATTAQFYRVNGEGFQQRGVMPDISITATPAERRTESSNFGFDRLKAIEYSSQNMVDNGMVLSLRNRSRERRQASNDFTRLQDYIDWQERQTVRAIVALTETDYRLKMKGTPENPLTKSKLNVTDFYLNEVFLVATDYHRALGNKLAVPATIVQAPPVIDPAIARRRELANQRESLRQSIQSLERKLVSVNDSIVGAQVALLVAKTVYDDADAGSGAEFLAHIAYIAAERAYNDFRADYNRTASQLQAERSRYNQLVD